MIQINPIPSTPSGRGNARLASIFALCLGCWIAPGLRAELIVVPNTLATTNGPDTSSLTGDQKVRYMMMFDASQFAGLGGPSLLTQFAFRPKTETSPGGPRFSILRIYASTTKRSLAAMSTTFNQNIGTNNTLVFDGTLTLVSHKLPGPGNTRLFDVVNPLTTPFLYDPAEGNLVLDFQESSDNGEPLDYDAVTSNPTVRSLLNLDSPTADSGFFARPQVTQFTFEAPPLVTIRASQTEFCWNSLTNLTYQVQYRSELTTNLWTTIGNCVRGTGSRVCVIDPIILGQPQRFYQVAVTNCVAQ